MAYNGCGMIMSFAFIHLLNDIQLSYLKKIEKRYVHHNVIYFIIKNVLPIREHQNV